VGLNITLDPRSLTTRQEGTSVNHVTVPGRSSEYFEPPSSVTLVPEQQVDARSLRCGSALYFHASPCL
jgi:hypothetical protein